MNKEKCIAPWNILRIQTNGDCYICTPNFNKINYSIGNIYKNSFEEIWNGEIIKQIRNGIIKNNYDFCKIELCNACYKETSAESLDFELPNVSNPEYSIAPTRIYICCDYSCKQKCIFCRDKIKMITPEEGERYYINFEEKIFPIINKVKQIELNGEGEFLDSKYCKKLINNIININSNIKFSIISNGVDLTDQNLKELKLIDKIDEVRISLHSASPKVYNSIFRKDNFYNVLKNIEYISELKKKSIIKHFELMFVICSLNYKDIISFVEMAEKYDAIPSFSLANNSETEYTKNEIEYAIFSPEHRNYNDFLRILRNPKLNNYKKYMPNYLKELKPNPLFKVIKNHINYFSYKNVN